MAFAGRLHNPRRRLCGCPPECVCRRSALGRVVRWYIPGPFHTPVAPEHKAWLHLQGRDFREP